MNKERLVIKTISKVLKLEEKKIKKNLKIGDLPSWDSLAHINIYLELKKIFKLKNDISRLSRVKSVKDWLNLILQI